MRVAAWKTTNALCVAINLKMAMHRAMDLFSKPHTKAQIVQQGCMTTQRQLVQRWQHHCAGVLTVHPPLALQTPA